jgi:hypothetical protein
MIQSGPAVDPAEVELADVATLEVVIQWGTTVLHVQHLTPPRSFFVGEEEGPGAVCDYLVPAEKLGTTRAPVVLVEGGKTYVVVASGASGTIDVPGQSPIAIAEAVRLGRAEPCAELTGARKIALVAGAKARVEQGDFVFQVTAAHAGKPVPAGLFATRDLPRFGYAGLSLLAHASVMGALGLFVPAMAGLDEETAKRDQQYLIQQYMTSIAERERMEQIDKTDAADPDPTPAEGSRGERHKGEEGTMGKPTSKETGHRYGVRGDAAAADTHLSRQQALDEAAGIGMIGLLRSGAGGDPNAPTSPFGQDTSLGSDPLSANGNLWGDGIGESFGGGGLGLTGVGDGGGGPGVGVGLDKIGGLGNGLCGFGPCNGHGLGRPLRAHVAKSPTVRIDGTTKITGKLPAEVIQRIVRQNYGRFRACYESGLRANPGLAGRVAVRFAIGRDGSVSNVQNGGSDLPDSGVVSCVVRAYYGLTFPAPDGGIVTVVYPIMFTPGE